VALAGEGASQRKLGFAEMVDMTVFKSALTSWMITSECNFLLRGRSP
jgi:hypothetical protein